MDLLQPNTEVLPPVLRALALGLLVETVVPLISKSLEEEDEESPVPPGRDEASAEPEETEQWRTLRRKCRELSNLVLRANDPKEAAAYVLAYLPKHIEYAFELVHGQKRRLVLGGPETVYQVAGQEREPVAEPA
jgi:hypothetical protein